MKRTAFYICFAIMFVLESVALIIYAVVTPNTVQDTVAVNEVVQSVTRDYGSMDEHTNRTDLDYVVTDKPGNILFKTKNGLSESVNAAVAHRDTMMDIIIEGDIVGKIIIYNDSSAVFQSHKITVIVVVLIAIAIQLCICIGYAVYLNFQIVKPFGKLKGFAERVASGNLDIPLEMDRHNIFGAFTESFDIMRSELKRARLAEAQANKSKKELVAKLSHDIKTPVASVKAVSEVGIAVTTNESDRRNYEQIAAKADQINTLVTNLFSATLEELQQLSVEPTNFACGELKALLVNSDFMRRAQIPDMPVCLVYADKLRLQQVFDNIFVNSYKYADSDISVDVSKNDNTVDIVIEDRGGGVDSDELPIIKEKYKRGGNSAKIEGAGLGLYISDYFMREMGGGLTVENGKHGLRVTVSVLLSGILSS